MLFNMMNYALSILDNSVAKARKTTSLLSPFLVEDVFLDPISAGVVARYLHANYQILPSNVSLIVSRIVTVAASNTKELAFYQVHPDKQAFLYRGVPILCNVTRNEPNRGRISFLKGTVDIPRLLEDSRQFAKAKVSKRTGSIHFGRFAITEHHGGVSKMQSKMPPMAMSTSSHSTKHFDALSQLQENAAIYPSDCPVNFTNDEIATISRTSDPFDDLYFEQDILDLLADIEEWLSRDVWFRDRGLPWRLGVLLQGPGSTGKSSFFLALAKKFGLPLHPFFLSNMTNQDFKSEWQSATAITPCIVLFEDLDTVFHKRTPVSESCTLSFDTVLNVISGVSTTDGVILGVTTNHLEHIDEAMGVPTENSSQSSRPGRLDRIIYMGAMSETNRWKLANKVLRDWPEMVPDTVKETQSFTPGQVQEHCVQKALHKLQLGDSRN
jgi:SpoVK/Ycf46/Vps4 family AAA+-type ATPase